MSDKKCPQCGLWNTASALRCDCGYDFATDTMEDSYSGQPILTLAELKYAGKRHMTIGALWFIGGVIVTVASFTSTGGRTYVITYGAIIYGIFLFIKGALEYTKS